MNNNSNLRGIVVPGYSIGDGEKLFIIAEAGVNHNGDIERALAMVDVASEAGADAIKFQTFLTEEIITSKAPKAQYHIETTGSDDVQSWFSLLKSQELDRIKHERLIEYCKKRGIMFMSTPYDIPSVDLLDELQVEIIKIASTDTDNIPFLRYVASKRRPIILSTAMSTLDEVKASVDVIRAGGVDGLVVLQCIGSYPAPAAEASLRAMITIRNYCGVSVGYSDHVPGHVAAISAVALGACVYEKHFTMDRKLPGPDHRASLEPDELKNLIRDLREAEKVLGNGEKKVMQCENENRKLLRKKVVAARSIPPGTTITKEMLTTKRTGGIGLSPAKLDLLIGYKSGQFIEQDTALDVVGSEVFSVV